MPKVSVILTSYNHEKYIAKAIESVLTQTFTDFELVIVDDCSSDSSWDIIKSYNDPRIIAVRHEVNKRSSVRRNLHRCAGEYIAIHHSDDVWLPDKLKRQVEYLNEQPKVAACFTLVNFIDEEGQEFNPPVSHSYHKVFEQQNKSRFEWLRTFFQEGNRLCHPSVLIRKEAYKKHSLFIDGLAQIPDFVQWIRLCKKSEIHVIQEKLTLFRLRDNNANSSGHTALNSIRYSFEYFVHLTEYISIPENDFCKVFPESVEYQTEEGIIVEYAFARMNENGWSPMHKLFCMKTLFDLLNDPIKSKKIESMYNFTLIDFVKITAKYDIFNQISPHQWQNCSLHINSGNGFVPENRITLTNYVPFSHEFSVEFDLKSFDNVSSLRFCPHEGNFRKIKINSITIDGCRRNFMPISSRFELDGHDVFLSQNPVYQIEGTGEKVAITGEMYDFDNNTISELMLRYVYNENLISSFNENSADIAMLFFDTGEGFNAEETMILPYEKEESPSFKYFVSLGPDVRAVRFDPIESNACILRNLEIVSNKGYHTYKNYVGQTFDSLEIFDHTDPQIHIEIDGDISFINITGEVYKLEPKKLKLAYDLCRMTTDLNSLNQTVLELRNTISEQDKSAYSRDQTIQELHNMISEQDISVCTLNQTIFDLRNVISEQRDTVSKLHNVISERDIIMSSLNHELDAMRNSFCWKITRPARFISILLKKMFNSRS